jgi:large subunit ribosomal protein L3
MAGFPASHGTHEYFRHGGSIGNRKFPGRVFKNKRMGGHMGCDVMTQQNLKVVSVRPEENLLLVEGSIPGAKNSIVFVSSAIKKTAKKGAKKAKQ